MNIATADLIARRTLARYQMAIDAMSSPMLAEVFAEDAVLYRRGEPMAGRQAVLDFYEAFFPVVGHMRHFITGTFAEPDGDDVTAHSVFTYVHVRSDVCALGWGDYRHRIRPTSDTDGVIIEKHIEVHHAQEVPLEVAEALRPH